MLAYLGTQALAERRALRAVVRDRRPAVEVVPLPFVPKRYKR